ncbi:hypothetical protein [Spirulina sp. 06S082]|uniref:hypothetical protein n=1 Tax=Spirulina sp. 06S082 TaxID=3110248 RepID=UPI002B1FCDD0|nr:hypothetical protein [Spirulina sp. 06S082]MEA5467754.1 hypothetical protein [Spirulina sp. 06S082]
MESPIETREYEFDASQNNLIHNLANKMRFVAYVLIGLGLLEGIPAIVGLFKGNFEGSIDIILGIVQIIIGVWTLKSANSFGLVVKTEGHDIENLMGALGELRKLYSLQYWLFLIAFFFIALGTVLLIIGEVLGA